MSTALAQKTFASVRKHRNYRLYFGGQAVSFTGTWVQQIAASWLVLKRTGATSEAGLLSGPVVQPYWSCSAQPWGRPSGVRSSMFQSGSIVPTWRGSSPGSFGA